MATGPTRDVEAWLADLLDRVIGWLQFAESKNMGIVGIISTFLGLLVIVLATGPSVPPLARVGLAVCVLTLMLSLPLAIASLLPAADLETYAVGKHEPPRQEDNLLFYGHLARYEPRALVRAVDSHYAEVTSDDAAVSKLALDLAEQIVTNARIT